jgi:hypothetical protein
MFRLNARAAACLEQLLKPFVSEFDYHSLTPRSLHRFHQTVNRIFLLPLLTVCCILCQAAASSPL